VATAIANAESHAALTRLAEEQAALRRVATLVAQGVPPVQIFSAVPIVVEGRLWGAMTVASTGELLPYGLEGRLGKFTELLATAIANAESRSELAASRRRIVAAADEARRRIERDLHDGTQQRLVSLGLTARTAETDVTAGPGDLRAYLARIASGLADAVAELQEFLARDPPGDLVRARTWPGAADARPPVGRPG
jgi:signal transduction histidine kinase